MAHRLRRRRRGGHGADLPVRHRAANRVAGNLGPSRARRRSRSSKGCPAPLGERLRNLSPDARPGGRRFAGSRTRPNERSADSSRSSTILTSSMSSVRACTIFSTRRDRDRPAGSRLHRIVRITVRHRTSYSFDAPVYLEPHVGPSSIRSSTIRSGSSSPNRAGRCPMRTRPTSLNASRCTGGRPTPAHPAVYEMAPRRGRRVAA